MLKRLFAAAALIAASFSFTAAPASAHPHVWVTVKSELNYGSDGALTGVRHAWTFDEAFSSYALQGLETTADGKPSEKTLRELAQVNIESLGEFDYFTYARQGKDGFSFAPPKDYFLTHGGTQLTLHFTLPLQKPLASKGRTEIDVYDPTYFVAFQLADKEPIKLAGSPQACALTLQRPQNAPTETATLSEGFFDALTSSSDFGAQFSNKATVNCP